VEIMPMMRARLLTEALVMGGCFGGDGFTVRPGLIFVFGNGALSLQKGSAL
jgi:hypothetical protein